MSSSDRKLRGRLFVISSPSGGGKTSIIKRILQLLPKARFSVSATTRSPRAYETEGEAYWFLSRAEFEKRIREGKFIEYEEVHGEYYGTPKEPVEAGLESGDWMILDLDVKGGLQVKRLYPDSVLMFISPPSIETLRERLLSRGDESAAEIDHRLERAKMEMEAALSYDYHVVNDDLARAVTETAAIIERIGGDMKR